MDELISVIVPVYNGEQFIEKSLGSILNQTYDNLEIIVINDGSIDRSLEICNAFAEIDNRIKVINQSNSGIGAVRNKGIELASGELIGFVDQDDSIHPRMFEILIMNLKEENADISMCNFANVSDNNMKEHILQSDITIKNQTKFTLDHKEAFMDLYSVEKCLITVVPWNKLYKKKIFENIHYPHGKIIDDDFVIQNIIEASNKIIHTDAALYYYYQNNNSIIRQKFNIRKLEIIEAKRNRVLFFLKQKKYLELLSPAVNDFLHFIIVSYFSVREHCPTEKRVMKNLRKQFNEEYNFYQKFLKINKTELFLFSVHPSLFNHFIENRKKLYLIKNFLFERLQLLISKSNAN